MYQKNKSKINWIHNKAISQEMMLNISKLIKITKTLDVIHIPHDLSLIVLIFIFSHHSR